MKDTGKSIKRTIIVGAVVLLALIIWNSCSYTTQENEYTVVKQFGKICDINTEAGLKFKIPFIQSVNSIPNNIQFYDLPESDVITSDKKSMIVDAFVLWQVTDPKAFTSSLNANTATAEGRIDVIVYNAIKTTISNMTQEELIASRDDVIDVTNDGETLDDVEINDIQGEEENATTVKPEIIPISSKLLECIGDQCEQYGIVIKNVEIKVLDLPEENKAAVFDRMITERNNIAAAYTAQGQSEAQMIKNETDKETAVMISEAEANAAKIVAEGEAEYMKILSNAYNDEAKADFYLFSRSLDAAKASLQNGETTLFLDEDSPLAEIFSGVN